MCRSIGFQKLCARGGFLRFSLYLYGSCTVLGQATSGNILSLWLRCPGPSHLWVLSIFMGPTLLWASPPLGQFYLYTSGILLGHATSEHVLSLWLLRCPDPGFTHPRVGPVPSLLIPVGSTGRKATTIFTSHRWTA